MIEIFIDSIMISAGLILVSNFLLDNKSNLKSWPLYVAILVLTIYMFISYMITDSFLRTIVLFMVILVSNIYLCKKYEDKEIKSIVVSFYVWLLLLLSEIIYTITMIGIMGENLESMQSNHFGALISNTIILIIFLLLSCNKISQSIIAKLSKQLHNFKGKYLLFFSILSTIAFSIIFYLSYFKLSVTLTFVLNFIVVIIYIYIIYKLFQTKSSVNKIQQEYEALVTNLNDYENMLSIQKTINHESKNQLLTISKMVNANNTELKEYVDSLIEEKKRDNKIFLNKTGVIPTGGLRGLIYAKMLSMEELGIKPSLKVEKKVRKYDLSSLDKRTNKEFLQIVGVFLDNAIDATLIQNKKDILIRMYEEDDCFAVSISNHYSGTVDLQKIYTQGYSTKGKGRGYGLYLVNKLINGNNKLTNEKMINKDIFTQIVKIKM